MNENQTSIAGILEKTKAPITLILVNGFNTDLKYDDLILSVGRTQFFNELDVLCSFRFDNTTISREVYDKEIQGVVNFFSFFKEKQELPDTFQTYTGRFFRKTNNPSLNNPKLKEVADEYYQGTHVDKMVYYEQVDRDQPSSIPNIDSVISSIINDNKCFIGVDVVETPDGILICVFTIGEHKYRDSPEIIVVDSIYNDENLYGDFQILISSIVERISEIINDLTKGIHHPYAFKTKLERVFEQDMVDLKTIVSQFQKVQSLIDYYDSEDILFVFYQPPTDDQPN